MSAGARVAVHSPLRTTGDCVLVVLLYSQRWSLFQCVCSCWWHRTGHRPSAQQTCLCIRPLQIQQEEVSKTQSQHQEEFLCIFGIHTFVPISWMCKKQTSVSHSSTEAGIICLDAGLRMDGIPALTLWDSVIEIFHSVPNRIEQPKEELRETRCRLPNQTCTTSSNASTPTSFQLTYPTHYILVLVPCCMSLKTMKL